MKGLSKQNEEGVCMDDKNIVDLFWQRSEKAIVETDSKYGGYCFSIAYNVLANNEDSEESVSDTHMAAFIG